MTTLPDSSFLTSYREDLNECFGEYLDIICPLMTNFELVRGDFPVEVQNEIRAIYSHLARAAVAETAEDTKQNIQKIKSHTKRAILDCFKYNCVVYSDNYHHFFKRFEGVDLSYIGDGFLSKVHKTYREAIELLKLAKRLEVTNAEQDALYEAYGNAYEVFVRLDDQLQQAEEQATFLKHKATQKDWINRVSLVIGAVGLLLTILSMIH